MLTLVINLGMFLLIYYETRQIHAAITAQTRIIAHGKPQLMGDILTKLEAENCEPPHGPKSDHSDE